MTLTQKIKNNYLDVLFSALALICVIALYVVFAVVSPTDFSRKGNIAYFVLCAVPLILVGVFGIRSMKEKSLFQKLIFVLILSLIFVFIVLHSTIRTDDYHIFLGRWTYSYKNLSFKDALFSTLDVSNYTPVYNYLLILVSRLDVYWLFAIKYITFGFSFLLAFAIEKVISFILKEKFNFLRFAFVLALPSVMIEYSAWGQCDAIYTSFAILAFYFALKKKSKLSFIFVGLSFAFKLQFLFIVPVLFIMLIAKDADGKHYLKWKDIWIAPLMYLVNFAPVLVGRPVLDVLTVYLSQTSFDKRISGNCPNICSIFYLLGFNGGSAEFPYVCAVMVAITFLVLAAILFIAFKTYKQKGLSHNDLVFFGFIMSFSMVFFMPKMLDRFYFIALEFAFINFFVSKNNENFRLLLLSICMVFFMMYLHLEAMLPYPLSVSLYFVGLLLGFLNAFLTGWLFVKRYVISIYKEQKIKKEKV